MVSECRILHRLVRGDALQGCGIGLHVFFFYMQGGGLIASGQHGHILFGVLLAAIGGGRGQFQRVGSRRLLDVDTG